MENLSLYRKYRPQKLSEVVGQEHITRTLKNQIKTGKINHAYLFCGSRGVGKTSVARIFAKAINCQRGEDGEPCFECEVCSFLSRENLDVVEIDAASNNRVDEIRELREKVKFPPVVAKKKVYIIDEVHMLSDSAFNALLKTLEEPPAHVVFILATTEPQKLPATILSRCVRFDFKLIGLNDLEKLLKNVFEKEGVSFDEASLKLITDTAMGSARDLLSIADMCVSFCNRNLTYEKVLSVLGAIDKNILIDLNEGVLDGDVQKVFEIYSNFAQNGKGVNLLIKEELAFYKDLTLIITCENSEKLVSLPQSIFERMKGLAKKIAPEKIVDILGELARLEVETKTSLNAQLLFEAFLIKKTLSSKYDFSLQEKKISDATVKEQSVERPAQKESLENSKAQSRASFSKVFGRLLTELKNQGYMALYGLLSEIDSGRIENSFLIGTLKSDSGISLLEKDVNKQLINKILTEDLNENLKFKFEIETKTVKDDFNKLKALLGGKLKIE